MEIFWLPETGPPSHRSEVAEGGAKLYGFRPF